MGRYRYYCRLYTSHVGPVGLFMCPYTHTHSFALSIQVIQPLFRALYQSIVWSHAENHAFEVTIEFQGRFLSHLVRAQHTNLSRTRDSENPAAASRNASWNLLMMMCTCEELSNIIAHLCGEVKPFGQVFGFETLRLSSQDPKQ
jgi:hypothetical protein